MLDAAQLRAMQATVREVAVEETLTDYLLDIITATRSHAELQLGVSTRGAISSTACAARKSDEQMISWSPTWQVRAAAPFRMHWRLPRVP